ncbi:dihydrofolate reductase [Chitinophaga parva]|uniref:Dihydrofolate reductase n=1 Tax=Chitinophaga parva TaxID=2169414 RepID=A0A2T7BLW6_9BACT|nr:dihydrofolate reductase family protein [Chitinophaga parva]PUZ28662.1 dihydrofolate reductase [Chitinophaga parva]
MRKLIMKMSMSIDGFVAGPNGEHDWVFRNSDEQSRAWSAASFNEAGIIIMGRKSFESMAPYWPTATGPFAAPMNTIPKALFTQKGFKGMPNTAGTPAGASWAEARIFHGDLVEGIRELKQEEGKPIIAIGGAGFVRNLIETGLIDEYQLAIHPIMFGAGLPVFTGLSKPLDLKLVDARTFPGGIIANTYRPA